MSENCDDATRFRHDMRASIAPPVGDRRRRGELTRGIACSSARDEAVFKSARCDEVVRGTDDGACGDAESEGAENEGKE